MPDEPKGITLEDVEDLIAQLDAKVAERGETEQSAKCRLELVNMAHAIIQERARREKTK